MKRIRSFLLVSFLLASMGSSAAERWPGLRRVVRDGQASNYAVQLVRDLKASEIVSQFSLSADDMKREPDQTIDLNAGDEFTQALDAITLRAQARLEKSASIAGLMRKSDWSMQDRIEWERELALTESEERHRYPGLGAYRNIFNREHLAKKRPPRLNDLSEDIRNSTDDLEFDCEQMSAVDGLILDRLEGALLPARGRGYKRAFPYARATGYIYMEFDVFNGVKDDYVSGHHVFLISPATGSIIEATADPLAEEAVYRTALHGWNGVEGYLRGESVITHVEKKIIYYTSLPNDAEARLKVAAEKQESYVGQIQPLAGRAQKELGALQLIFSAYEAQPEVQRLNQILSGAAGRGLTAGETEELRGILSGRPLREAQSSAKEKLRVLRFRIGNLRYLESRLQRDDARHEAQTALATLLGTTRELLRRTIFDVETISLPESGSAFAVKEKLSGKYRLRVAVSSLEGVVLPAVRVVSAEEDINLEL